MSQIIPLGIGSPAEIKELVLTGLSPGVLPPPPVPGISSNFQIANPGELYYSFNSFSSLIYTDGVEFSLPARNLEITWQTIFGSTPSVASIEFQVSLDGLNWIAADSSSNTAGDLRTFKTSARFCRAAILDMTEGIVTSVVFVVKPTEMWES